VITWPRNSGRGSISTDSNYEHDHYVQDLIGKYTYKKQSGMACGNSRRLDEKQKEQ